MRKLTVVIMLVLMLAAALTYTNVAQQWVAGLAYAVEAGRADAAKEQLVERAPGDLEHAFELAAQAIQPSVVSITSVRRIQLGQAPPSPAPGARGRSGPGWPFGDRFRGLFDDDTFERFFFFDNAPPRGGGNNFTQEGLGSGVIVDERGHVLTNNHVVTGADELNVRLSDGRSLPAKLVGTDPKSDLAVIKVEQSSTLRPAKLADSDDVKVGQWVMAVGSMGLDQTVTAGIVSYKGRANLGIADYEDFIQTDAAINQGNSGGPLVNLKGEVVGINTAILSRSGGNQGIGMAIPSNMAKDVMERLINDGKVVRGWLGVSIQELDDALASSFGYDRNSGPAGVLIGEVVPNGPAKNAGVQTGDIVMSLDGKPATDPRAFRNRVAQLKPGNKVSLEVWRDRKTHKLEVEIGEAPQTPLAGGGGVQGPVEQFGLAFGDLSPELRQQFGLTNADAAGALITAVAPGSVAERGGIRPGDLIVDVQGTAIRSAKDPREALSKYDPKKGVRLRLQRGESMHFVFLKNVTQE
jgi:serine protease Do